MPHYRIAGVCVDSDVALPGVSVDDAFLTADVSICRGAVPETLDGATVVRPQWMLRDDAILLSLFGVARILVEGGRLITFCSLPGHDEADVLPFLITALGVILQQRGEFVLHASAIDIGGRAVLFCGRSGVGKSTLAGALMKRGLRLIVDDVATVAFDAAGRPAVCHDTRDLKLWTDSLQGLGLDEAPRSELQLRRGKYYLRPTCSGAQPDCPIAAVYFLNPPESPDVETSMRSLFGAEAAAALRNNVYRPRLVRAMHQEATCFRDSAAVLRYAPVFELRLARGWDRLEGEVDRVSRHWADFVGNEAPAAPPQ
jgi:hypothetical protein